MKEDPIKVAIKDEDGKVIWAFSRKTESIVMDPENARQIAEGTAKAAYAAVYGKAPEEGRSIITEDVQTKLLNRLTLSIRSLQDQNKLPGYIAAEVLNIVLREVT